MEGRGRRVGEENGGMPEVRENSALVVEGIDAAAIYVTDAAAATASDVISKQFECTVKFQHVHHGQPSSGQLMLDTRSKRLW